MAAANPRRFILAGALCLTTSVLGGCTSAPEDNAADAPTVGTEVTITDNRFEPATLQATAGGTVTWTWSGDSPHDVSGDGFASDVQRDGTFTHTFEQPGEYDYVCSLHSGMRGTVVVVET